MEPPEAPLSDVEEEVDFEDDGVPLHRMLEFAESRKRKRLADEIRDDYRDGDEDDLLNIVDKEDRGSMDDVIAWFMKHSREIGDDAAATISADHFNKTIYAADQSYAKNVGGEPVLAKKATKSSLLHFRDRLKSRPRGAELDLSDTIEYIQHSIQQIQDNGLWTHDLKMDAEGLRNWTKLEELKLKFFDMRDKLLQKSGGLDRPMNKPKENLFLPKMRGQGR